MDIMDCFAWGIIVFFGSATVVLGIDEWWNDGKDKTGIRDRNWLVWGKDNLGCLLAIFFGLFVMFYAVK